MQFLINKLFDRINKYKGAIVDQPEKKMMTIIPKIWNGLFH